MDATTFKSGGTPPVSKLWNDLPTYARAATGALTFTVFIALVTENVIATVTIGIVTTAFFFCWPAMRGFWSVFLALALIPTLLALLFATAHIHTPAPVPTQRGQFFSGIYEGNSLDQSFDCGSPLFNPLHNPIAQWSAENQSLITTGMERATDTENLVSACGTSMNDFRRDAAVFLVPIVLVALTAIVSGFRKSMRREHFGPS